MSQLPRVMTSPELAFIRTDGQSSELFLWADVPPVVYSARVNQTFTTLDMVAQITYNTGSGTLANVLPGMTLYIGSAAGLYDIGMARIRKAPSGTIFYIGEESDLPLADNLYLTVVDQFLLWPRHPELDVNNVEYMDFDIVYSDQHTNPNPVPCIGPRYVPAWLTGATVDTIWDSSNSWIPDGTVLSYVWTAPGASATSGLTTATPSITYNAAGRYRVKCTVTSTNGKSTDAYAYVRVFTVADPPITQFEMKDCSGSWQRGGWQMHLTMWAQADFSSIVERSACVVFARDFYGGTETSLSPVAGRENIILEGWIDGESMVQDPEGASLEFTVEGPNAWLDKITGFPVGIQNTTVAATAWTNWKNVTVDDSLFHLLYWQATVIPVIDVFPTNDTRVSPEQSVPGEMTVWGQIIYLLTNTILGRALSDRYARLFCEIDTDLLPVASRSSIPIVMTLTYSDWRDQAKLTRYIVTPTARMAASGVAVPTGEEAQSIFSLSPGHVFKWHGKSLKQDRLLLSDQVTANVLSGLLVSRDNKQFDFTFDLSGNNRMVDIAPRQRVHVDIIASDTPRGITFAHNMLVRDIQITPDPGGFLLITWQGENETGTAAAAGGAENVTNGDVPNSPSLSPFPPIKLPKLPILPPLPPIGTLPPGNIPGINTIVMAVQGANKGGIVYTKDFLSASPHWFSWNTGLPVTTAAIMQMEISPISGRAFVIFDPRGTGISGVPGAGIYTSPGVGQPWTVFFTNAQALAMNPNAGADTGSIMALGVNRNAADEVAIIMISHFDGTNVALKTKLAHGSSSGLVAGGFPANQVGKDNGSMMYYGGGKWVASMANGYFYRFSLNTISIELETAMGGYYQMSKDALDGGRSILWNGTTTLKETPDNGATFTNITAPTAPDVTVWLEACATDPTGLYIMYCPHLSIAPQKSSDGGATWSAMGTPAVVVTAIWNLGDAMHWVVEGGLGIWYTEDFGATWVDKRGDLDNLLGIGWVGQSLRSLSL